MDVHCILYILCSLDSGNCVCTDPTSTCIMAAISGNPPPTIWSDCSEQDLAVGYSRNLDSCLSNEPTMTVGEPSCGNGIREGNEICDCGSPEVKRAGSADIRGCCNCPTLGWMSIIVVSIHIRNCQKKQFFCGTYSPRAVCCGWAYQHVSP